MGCFSWLDCISKQQIKMYSDNVRFLIPKELGGGSYSGSYNGYGCIGSHDVYEEVALINRQFINPEDFTKPKYTLEQFGGLYGFEKDELRLKGMSEEEINKIDKDERQKYYDAHLRSCEYKRRRLMDFVSGKDEDYMISQYGDDFLREIGIDIACYDEDNSRLRFPIKITYEPNAVYEDCEYSLSDPDQGL